MNKIIPAFTIILAAGKGTRMGVDTRPKVCFEVCGVPAIIRAMRAYHACGIKQHVIVVGNLAGQVIETVESFLTAPMCIRPSSLAQPMRALRVRGSEYDSG